MTLAELDKLQELREERLGIQARIEELENKLRILDAEENTLWKRAAIHSDQ